MADLSFLKDVDITTLSPDEQLEFVKLIEGYNNFKKYNRINDFTPYPFQAQFFDASGKGKRRFLCAANRVGKTFSEAVEMAYHLTGKYPEWWTGHRFKSPILAWAIGISSDSTRKVMQKELFGTEMAKDDGALGTGTIQRTCIDFDKLERDGNAVKIAKIKHYDADGDFDGWSTLEFRSTGQGMHVLMGSTVDYIWLDEEDKHNSMEIYSQCVTRTATTGGLVVITATPENGLTDLVKLFQENKEGTLYYQNATWDDAPHLSEEDKAELISNYQEWEIDMRRNGIPAMGEALVYQIDEGSIMCDPFEIPSHWKRVCGVDIGISHDTAAVWSAYDAQSDTIYIYDCYAAPAGVPSLHATAINGRGKWIPVILPHDADNTERGSGRTVADYYRDAGVNTAYETFYNPIGTDGVRNYHVEPGIIEMTTRMRTGRLKVFNTCSKFFEEMRRYHRKGGKINKMYDDTMDAARYSVMSVKTRGVSKGESEIGFTQSFDDWNVI